MTDAELNRALNSVGKKCFVAFYATLGDLSLAPADAAATISNAKKSSFVAVRGYRVRPARKIFVAGREHDALAIIAESNRVAPEARERARSLFARGTGSV
jgi:hypothetical protein